MKDFYNGPTFAILGILVAVFATLYKRSKTQRSLLWLLGWSFATARLAFQLIDYGSRGPGWVISNLCLELPPLMFIGSMTSGAVAYSERFKWIAALTLPLSIYLATNIMDPHPVRAVGIGALVVMVAVAIAWAAHCNHLPRRIVLPILVALAPALLHFAINGDARLLLELMHTTSCLLAAILVLFTYRRLSPGVLFTAAGLFIWSLPFIVGVSVGAQYPSSYAFLRVLNIAKIATAIGMIVLALEDEIRLNESSQRRDRRTRAEMAEYSKLFLGATPRRDYALQYQQFCEVITRASRFSQAAILLRNLEQDFQVVGSSGMPQALVQALAALGKCLSEKTMNDCFRANTPAAPQGSTRVLHLKKIRPDGDTLEALGVHSIHAISLQGASNTIQGVLFLHGLRSPSEVLDEEDMLPLELLVSRLTSAHENNLLLRRIVQSEKLAGLGQLTGGVAHELNNPLTVVMGYAELIAETESDETTRDYARVIYQESQRMRQTIESLARFWKTSPDELAPISVEQMLRDIEQLRRPEFERAGVLFMLTIADGLPRIRANGNQIRQVLLQVLNNASTALKGLPPQHPRHVRIDARLNEDKVQVLVRDSGPGFSDIQRVFDPFFTTKAPGEGPGLGLSLCYSIIREHGGEIAVSNLQPYGAAVSIEMPIEQLFGRALAQ